MARRGIAAWYFHKKSPEAIQTAIRCDPHNPQYLDALATVSHFYADNEDPNEQVKLYEQAARLSPQNASFWADLGAGYDWAGREKEAVHSLERARDLFPNSPKINWRLANFYIRAGKTPEGLRALRKVLRGGGIPPEDVYKLAASAQGDKQAILREMVPPEASLLIDYMNYRAKAGDMVAADQVWKHLLELKLPFEAPQTFFYLDALIRKQDTARLTKAWDVLSERFPGTVGSLRVPPNLVTNGSFETDILNGGMDWRVVPVEGATVSLDSQEAPDRKRSLQIQFDGTQNLDYGHVFQYVLVRPNTRYQFSGSMRTKGITTDSGPRFEVIGAYDVSKGFQATESLVGTTNWTEEHLEFTTPAETSLLIIRVARRASEKFDNKIAGSVWIDRVRLVAEE